MTDRLFVKGNRERVAATAAHATRLRHDGWREVPAPVGEHPAPQLVPADVDPLTVEIEEAAADARSDG